jgi:hypothetical protein
MGIRMLSGYDSYRPYYRTSEIPVVSTEEVKQQEMQKEQPKLTIAEEPNSQLPQQPSEDFRTRTADLENISLTFNKEETFDYIGTESGLADLDMQKAISDMRKDEILQGYQYFVGSANTLFQSEDGMVIPK